MIAQATIEEIKNRASLTEVVGETVTLKRQGSSYVGLCPFHEERTPSFHVRDETFYHCFGCGESGSVISFIMKLRGLDFPEAIEELASRYGIEVKREGNQPSAGKKGDSQGLYRINRLAATFFYRNLQAAPEAVKRYVEERHLTNDALRSFGVGFAPAQFGALRAHLKSKQFSQELVESSGLQKRSQKGEWYDTFRGRLIFPIFIDSKRIAGFGGRLIAALHEEGAGPKYLNSSESPVYQKNKILFGVPQASQAIRSSGEVFLVEGYLDVIGLWQVGVREVLATCGTALTPQHVQRLSRLSKTVVLLFDGDDAGRAAAGKSFPTFVNSGLNVQAVFLPSSEDPDTFAWKHKQETRAALESLGRQDLFDCHVQYLMGLLGLKEARNLAPAQKGKLCEELCLTLAKIENAIERAEFVQKAAMTLLIEPTLLEQFLLKKSPDLSANSRPIAIKAELDTQVVPEVEQLPAVDRQVLYVVMAQKERVVRDVMSDPVLANGLSRASMQFVQALQELVNEYPDHNDARKDATRNLLERFGPSWIAHWKQAHTMSADPNVRLEKVLEECRRALRKGELIQEIGRVEELLRHTSVETDRMLLLQDKLTLDRQLRVL